MLSSAFIIAMHVSRTGKADSGIHPKTSEDVNSLKGEMDNHSGKLVQEYLVRWKL